MMIMMLSVMVVGVMINSDDHDDLVILEALHIKVERPALNKQLIGDVAAVLLNVFQLPLGCNLKLVFYN